MCQRGLREGGEQPHEWLGASWKGTDTTSALRLWIQIYLFLFGKNQRLEILYLTEWDFKNKHRKVSCAAFLSHQTTACSITPIICQRMSPTWISWLLLFWKKHILWKTATFLRRRMDSAKCLISNMCHLKLWACGFAISSFHICLKVHQINPPALETRRCNQFSPTLPFQKRQIYCKQAETLPLKPPLRRIPRGWQHWRMVGISTKMTQ